MWDAKDPSKRGIPGPELATLYRHWGQGGWGQILTGNIMIDPYNVEAAGNYVIKKDDPYSGPRFEGFQKIAEGAKVKGGLIVGQVSHAGRQVDSKNQPNPISASDVQLVAPLMGATYGVPRPATEEDIKGIIEGFAHAAEYLEKAGFDGIQLHGAHGYLLAQFLSETTNKRTDKYGGSLENRMRLILEIAAEIKKRVSKSFILGIKVNSVEFQEKGFQPEEAATLCKALEDAEFDYVELSGGTYEKPGFQYVRESTRKRENFFIEFAEQIVKPLKTIKVYTTGGFKTVGGAVDALNTVDGVGIGKAACQEPRLPNDVLEGKIIGFIKPAYDDNNVGVGLFTAAAQIRQIAHNLEPVDLSDSKKLEGVMADIQAQMAKKAEDITGTIYQPATVSAPSVPYGTTEA